VIHLCLFSDGATGWFVYLFKPTLFIL